MSVRLLLLWLLGVVLLVGSVITFPVVRAHPAPASTTTSTRTRVPRTSSARVLTATAPVAAFATGVYTTTITRAEISDPALKVNAGNWRFIFAQGGRFSGVQSGTGGVQTSGTYMLDGSQITINDTFGRGVYTWTLESKALALTVVDDDFASRVLVLTIKPLQKAQDTPMFNMYLPMTSK